MKVRPRPAATEVLLLRASVSCAAPHLNWLGSRDERLRLKDAIASLQRLASMESGADDATAKVWTRRRSPAAAAMNLF
jgi:hypothetical protein